MAPATVFRLQQSDITTSWPLAAKGWLKSYEGPDGQDAHALAQVEGQCVFLMEDDGCAVHRFVGPEAKPWFCRRFPMHTVVDPKGPVAIVRPACQGHHRSFFSGPLLQPEELASVVGAVPESRSVRFEREVVGVLPGRGVSLDDWMYLEGVVLTALEDGQGSPWDLARLIRGQLQGIMKGVWPQPNPERAALAVDFWLQAMIKLLDHAADYEGGRPAQRERVVSVRAMLERAEGRDMEPQLTPEAQAYVAHHLASEILGKEVHSETTFSGGMGRFMLGVDLVARAWPEGPVPVEAFGVPWAHWYDIRLNRAVRGLHREVGSLLVDRFLLC